MDGYNDSTLEGTTLGVSLCKSNAFMLGDDEGTILRCTNGEMLGFQLKLQMELNLGLMKKLSWVLQIVSMMVLMK